MSAARSRPVPDQSGARSAHQLVPWAVYLLPWSARSGLRRVARAPGVARRAVAGGPLHPPAEQVPVCREHHPGHPGGAPRGGTASRRTPAMTRTAGTSWSECSHASMTVVPHTDGVSHVFLVRSPDGRCARGR